MICTKIAFFDLNVIVYNEDEYKVPLHKIRYLDLISFNMNSKLVVIFSRSIVGIKYFKIACLL